MSILVAVSDGVRVCMASDSQATNNGSKLAIASPKYVRRGRVLFGACSLEMLSGIAHDLSLPLEDIATGELEPWAARVFIPAMRRWLTENGFMRKDTDGQPLWPAHVLLAHRGSIVVADSGGGHFVPKRGWICTGSGGSEASGALAATFPREISDAASAATLAVAIACDLDSYCSGPIHHEYTQR